MKKNLLLMMMCVPVILAAQNGVTVSNLAVDAGTVTFNVSWNKATMPMALWSDTVWVFVDYNKNGKMERLPVTDATVSAGTVIKIPNNDKGVWVAGNARDAGTFSATVKLFTATANLTGACAYASNYPPAGEYSSSDATEISFTGTPMYEIQLAYSDGESATVKSGDTFLLPCDYTLASFTDATGAPGIMKCVPMTGDIDFIVPAVSKSRQASFVVGSEPDVPNPVSITYRWSAPDFTPVTQDGGKTFTATAPDIAGTYSVTLTAQSERYCDLAITKDVEVLDCTAPGSTVTFTAFNPCSNATTGDYWHLTDMRELNNIQTYKVKKLPDGRIWMVQDMKFGDKCDKTTFTGSTRDQTGNVTTLTDKTYYGDCSNIRGTSTPPDRGYFYDWAAVLNKSGAFNGSTSNVGCAGTGSSVNACQGICPGGWHIPTADPAGEFTALKAAIVDTNLCPPATCGYTICEGVRGGWINTSGGLSYTFQNHYTSSSMYSATEMFIAYLDTSINASYHNQDSVKQYGYRLRCVMNF
jgi:uncharacterized protein (TIGR02145 family)